MLKELRMWWHGCLSQTEQQEILASFRPLSIGRGSACQDVEFLIFDHAGSEFSFLIDLSGWIRSNPCLKQKVQARAIEVATQDVVFNAATYEADKEYQRWYYGRSCVLYSLEDYLAMPEDLVLGIKWLGTPKGLSTECAEMDGKTWSRHDESCLKSIYGHFSSFKRGCACDIVPVLD